MTTSNGEEIDTTTQVIMKDGRPEWAVVPYAEYEALLAQAERLAQLEVDSNPESACTAKPAVANDEAAEPENTVNPAELLEKMQQLVSTEAVKPSENAQMVQALREAKGLDLAALAKEVGISPAYLGQIERGEREASEPIRRNIARGLGVEISELSFPSL